MTVYFDDFETATGWTVNPNSSDSATSGVWERGNPEDTTSSGAKQLGTTVSGSYDLVTGALAGSSATANDLDGGVSSIQSSVISLPSNGTFSTGTLNSTGRSTVNKTGKTQFKVYFTLDDNNDLGADYISFYSGEAASGNQPELVITYTP